MFRRIDSWAHWGTAGGFTISGGREPLLHPELGRDHPSHPSQWRHRWPDPPMAIFWCRNVIQRLKTAPGLEVAADFPSTT